MCMLARTRVYSCPVCLFPLSHCIPFALERSFCIHCHNVFAIFVSNRLVPLHGHSITELWTKLFSKLTDNFPAVQARTRSSGHYGILDIHAIHVSNICRSKEMSISLHHACGTSTMQRTAMHKALHRQLDIRLHGHAHIIYKEKDKPKAH